MNRDEQIAVAIAAKNAKALAGVATRKLPDLPLADELRLLGQAIEELAGAVKVLGEGATQ
jgi:hypothetical protein